MSLDEMHIQQTNTFKKYLKKLPAPQKKILDKEVKAILEEPSLGALKKGDLSGIRVHKFKINQQLMLLAYFFDPDEQSITLLALGNHENFYRDLKR